MTCYHPRVAARAGNGRFVVGQHSLVSIKIPCNQCMGCRLEYSRVWALRCMHEMTLHDDNCFLTLTYDNEHLPDHASLYYPHIPAFIKRLRAVLKRRLGRAIRFFGCGEYGEQTQRPHYHLIIFGYDARFGTLSSARPYRKSGEHLIYESEFINRIWSQGNVYIGGATFDSAGYVARYITKKVTGSKLVDHYGVKDSGGMVLYNTDTGELCLRAAERSFMSRRPGIGAAWYAKYKDDVYKDDSVVVNGLLTCPPRYYDKKLRADNEVLFAAIKQRRLLKTVGSLANNTDDRLRVREIVAKSKYNLFLKRGDV